MSSKTTGTISAKYSSPTSGPFSVTETFTAPTPNNLDSKTKYLDSLREALSAVQDQVNKELTARVEEDKTRDAAQLEASKNGTVPDDDDEAKAEENYGEEIPDEEDL